MKTLKELEEMLNKNLPLSKQDVLDFEQHFFTSSKDKQIESHRNYIKKILPLLLRAKNEHFLASKIEEKLSI